MEKIILDFEITGCLNHCYHCHCDGGAKQRQFMAKDDVIRVASQFREKLGKEVSVRLVQEQTYYPDFFELVNDLENRGFMQKGNKKLLVTNGWGLANQEGFADKLRDHFGAVKITLFGIDNTHDIHAGRKGSFDEIIKASKVCLEQGLDIIWQIMLSHKNSREIDKLFKVGKDLGIENIFVTSEHYYSGKMQNSSKMKDFFPRVSDLQHVKEEVYEVKEGLIKPEKEYPKDLEKNIDYGIKQIDFNEIYINKNFNVYPIFHISPDFLLGNALQSLDKIADQILYNKNLPTSIVKKNKLTFKDLIRKYADGNSDELHTPQSLFDKLSTKELYNR